MFLPGTLSGNCAALPESIESIGVFPSGGGSPVATSDDLLAQIVRSSCDAIAAETLDGTVTVWNRAAEELYGYPADDMIGARADRLYPAGRRDGEAAIVRRVAGGERLAGYVSERIRRDGTAVRVCVRATPIVDGTGLVTGVATMSWAASARTGHELRTSLNAIIGFTGTLLMRLPGPLNDEQEHQLRLVRASAETLLADVNRLTVHDGR